MRAFLALNLDGELRERLHRDTAALRAAAPDATWVRAENLHLTLKFLGDVDPPHARLLADTLQATVARHPVIQATLAGAGAFPDLRRPRVIWIGARDQSALKALAADVDRACAAAGFPPEARPFSAHVTLGRVKRPLGRDAAGALASAAHAVAASYPVRLGSVDLMQSELAPGGSRYSVVASLPLGSA
ncbi:MAG TPA: RNA 2',3'-cyclic phosphodiesterase [Gemmatimonadaceae bacterium]|nr:RNA 2',3'-cyclic phosphodiesterase [Gemmatimonadaceae bacterium]